MYQFFTPPWIGMSRITRSDEVLAPPLVTWNNRKIGRAVCQSCPIATWARWMLGAANSQQACSQKGPRTIKTNRSLIRPFRLWTAPLLAA
jgi:hypothetical protein